MATLQSASVAAPVVTLFAVLGVDLPSMKMQPSPPQSDLRVASIIVPMDASGNTRQKIRKIGMVSSDTAQLFFDNVRVPRRNLIGQDGMGFMFQMMQFQAERL